MLIDENSVVNFASFFLPGPLSYTEDLLYVLSYDPAHASVSLSKSTLAVTQTDLTITFNLLSSLVIANPGGRVVSRTSGEVFACVFDID